MSATTKPTVLICGAGIGGPLLALSLRTHPDLCHLFTPILLDRLPCPPTPETFTTATATYATGLGVVLSCNAIHSLHALGLKDDWNRISCEVLTDDIFRARGKVGETGEWWNRMVSPAYDPYTDTGLRAVERGMLQSFLVHRYMRAGGEARWGCKVAGVEQTESGVSVVLESGERIGGDLVVGADGVWSVVRKAMVPEKDWKPDFYDHSGIFGLCPRPEGKSDDEVVGKGHVVLTDGGMASTWPLNDGRQLFTLHSTERVEPSGRSENTTIPAYSAEFAAGGYSIESSVEIMKRYEKVFHPLTGTFGEMYKTAEKMGRVALYSKVWSEEQIVKNGNMVLVGDAAKTVLPSTGQGACFAIEEATVLANALLNNPPAGTDGKLSFAAALKEYASARYPRSKRLATEGKIKLIMGMGDRWWSGFLRDFATRKIRMDADNRATVAKGIPLDLGWCFGAKFDIKKRE